MWTIYIQIDLSRWCSGRTERRAVALLLYERCVYVVYGNVVVVLRFTELAGTVPAKQSSYYSTPFGRPEVSTFARLRTRIAPYSYGGGRVGVGPYLVVRKAI